MWRESAGAAMTPPDGPFVPAREYRQCDDCLNRVAARDAKMRAMARSPVLQFVLGSLAAMVVVVVGCFFALRSVTSDESLRDTRTRVELDGRLVESAGL